MDLSWSKGAGGDWCELDALDLSAVRGHGVFVLWKRGKSVCRPAVIVRVGHGEVATRLAALRRDPAVTRHGPGLLVTWANVAPIFSGGIEVYLTQHLKPLEGVRFPFAAPVEVNLPISA